MTPKESAQLNTEIRTQGLIGVTLLLLTMVMFVYRSGTADGTRGMSVAEMARVALQTGQSDLYRLFDDPGREHNIALLKPGLTFGWDFVPAWMCFIFFLQRIITKYGPGRKLYLWCALVAVVFTLFADSWLNGFIATAERQPVTDAEWNRIMFFGTVKWAVLFVDAFLFALQIILTPPILMVGAIILGISSLIAFLGLAGPSGLLIIYAVLGLFVAFSGINMLLLFQPQLLYAKWKFQSDHTEEPPPKTSDD